MTSRFLCVELSYKHLSTRDFSFSCLRRISVEFQNSPLPTHSYCANVKKMSNCHRILEFSIWIDNFRRGETWKRNSNVCVLLTFTTLSLGEKNYKNSSLYFFSKVVPSFFFYISLSFIRCLEIQSAQTQIIQSRTCLVHTIHKNKEVEMKFYTTISRFEALLRDMDWIIEVDEFHSAISLPLMYTSYSNNIFIQKGSFSSPWPTPYMYIAIDTIFISMCKEHPRLLHFTFLDWCIIIFILLASLIYILDLS